MSTDTGGPAFPGTDKVLIKANIGGERMDYEKRFEVSGMTLRDYFAITLLAGDAKTPGETCDGYMEQRARVAYAYADAMLAQRSK